MINTSFDLHIGQTLSEKQIDGILLSETRGEQTNTLRLYGTSNLLILTETHGDPTQTTYLSIIGFREYTISTTHNRSYERGYRELFSLMMERSLTGWDEDLEEMEQDPHTGIFGR